jgi:hypothetical protein
MGRQRNRPITLKIQTLMFLGGALAVALSICEMIYRAPMGYFGARATAQMLGLGLIFMVAPIWGYFRRRKSQKPNV